jgi:hypothetical protein
MFLKSEMTKISAADVNTTCAALINSAEIPCCGFVSVSTAILPGYYIAFVQVIGLLDTAAMRPITHAD